MIAQFDYEILIAVTTVIYLGLEIYIEKDGTEHDNIAQKLKSVLGKFLPNKSDSESKKE